MCTKISMTPIIYIAVKLHTVLLSGVSSQVGGKYNFPMDQRLLNIYARNRTDPIDVIEGNAIIDIFHKAQLFCFITIAILMNISKYTNIYKYKSL